MTTFIPDVGGTLHRLDRFDEAHVTDDNLIRAIVYSESGSVRIEVEFTRETWQQATTTSTIFPASQGFYVLARGEDGSEPNPFTLAIIGWRLTGNSISPVTLDGTGFDNVYNAVLCPDGHVEHTDGRYEVSVEKYMQAGCAT